MLGTSRSSILLLAMACLLPACEAPPPRAGLPAAREAGPDPGGPRELAALAMLAGRWQGTSRTVVLATGETFESRAETVMRWACGGRYLLEETVRELGPYGTSSDLGVWGWDGATDTYRYWRFNSLGARESGVLRYAPDERTWYLESGTVAADGTVTSGAGTMRYLTDEAKRIHWIGMDAEGHARLYEVNGSSRRMAR